MNLTSYLKTLMTPGLVHLAYKNYVLHVTLVYFVNLKSHVVYVKILITMYVLAFQNLTVPLLIGSVTSVVPLLSHFIMLITKPC